MWERTEGWAAGLQLAGLARRGADAGSRSGYGVTIGTCSTISPPRSSRRSHRSSAICWSGRTAGATVGLAVRCRTAGDRFGQVLRDLDRADLFLVALDAEREWYRCHHLFRDVLLREAGDPTRDRTEMSCDGPRRGTSSTTRSTRRFVTCCGPTTRRPQRRCWIASDPWFWERGAACHLPAAGGPAAAFGGAAPARRQMAYAAAINGSRDRVTYWLDLADERIGLDTVIPWVLGERVAQRAAPCSRCAA